MTTTEHAINPNVTYDPRTRGEKVACICGHRGAPKDVLAHIELNNRSQ